LDKPGKVLSAEFDLVFFNQAEEGSVRQWEYLLTRMRNNVSAVPTIDRGLQPRASDSLAEAAV